MHNQSRLHLVRKVTVVFAALGCSFLATGEEVTWELKGVISHVQNVDLDFRSALAVDPESIPFAVGDEIRLLVTYDAATPGELRTDSGCPLGSPSYYFFNPITGGAISIGQVQGSLHPIEGRNTIGVKNAAGCGYVGEVFSLTARLTAPSIEDLLPDGVQFIYRTAAGCFANAGADASTLPSAPLDPATCPLDPVNSQLQVYWFNGNGHRRVAAWLFDGFTVGAPASDELTPIGSEVTVLPVVTLVGGGAPVYVRLTFDAVSSEGTTTVTASSDANGGAETPPPTFKVGDPPIYYDVQTTASFDGLVNLCFPWQEGQFGFEEGLALFHFADGVWQNVTTSLDINANIVCGQSSSLSPFAVFAPDYTFSGFYQPVDNLPTRNMTKAGQAIPGEVFARWRPRSRDSRGWVSAL